MPTYLFAYRAPRDRPPVTPEANRAWMSWFESLGSDVLQVPGDPVFVSRAVGRVSDDTTELGGYSLIAADDIEAAAELAAGCPLLARGGGIEVGEITPLMPDGAAATSGATGAAAG